MTEYVSVSEYAKMTNKDPGNIRRNLINGKLEGTKIGNQWVIPKSALYPSDMRIKSGNYTGYRKLLAARRKNPLLINAIKDMCKDISTVYGSSLDRIVLYGSYARGEEDIDSDVDIAVIINSPDTEKKHDLMTDIVVDYELKQGVTLSVILVDLDQYKKWEKDSPFYRNISKEGITLWKTA